MKKVRFRIMPAWNRSNNISLYRQTGRTDLSDALDRLEIIYDRHYYNDFTAELTQDELMLLKLAVGDTVSIQVVTENDVTYLRLPT